MNIAASLASGFAFSGYLLYCCKQAEPYLSTPIAVQNQLLNEQKLQKAHLQDKLI